ncbi:hypothetical protein [Arthrobacter sp. zg-Y1110]|uniref:hypothetical protein n=1 Tax=Arthrobacter sp. zg-Y1110 TaxID=2886932 RepID=UPI001D14392A|nr:hypothetical protein [Arthrobacter sp. zg-Y1110]MCC3292472.1 hypothetical protein [Arthrobacter sp. zg-Y1110]UWX87095.1 hypothetical protein N2K99_17240 [Arthrobacter sp. zg-Y1110]
MRTPNDIQLLLSNAVRPADRGEERHRVRWFIDNGIRAEFECLHPPVPAPEVCDAVNFEAGGADELVEFHEGDETPLRDGTIRSWWAQPGVSATYSWVYEEAPVVRAAFPESGPRGAAETTPASPGLLGSSNRTRPPQLHDVRWYICDGVAKARLTCLHKAAEHCDKTEFEEDDLLPFTHKGGRTVLRDGIIESWWTGDDWDGYDIHWDYTDTPSGIRA